MTSGGGKNIESQVQRLAHNAMALATGGIVAQLAFTLVEILIARKLGAESYGVFVTAFACVVLVSHFVEVGTPLWIIQEGSRNHERIPALLGSSLIVVVIMFAGCYSILVIFTSIRPPNPVLSFLLIFLPYSLVLTFQDALASVYSSYQTMHVSALFQGGAPVVILLLYLVYSANDLALADAAYAYVFGGATVTAIWFVYTLRRVRPHFSVKNIRTTLSSSYQYGISGILGHLYFKSDIIMLSALAGLHEAGIYAAAYKLVELVSKVAVLSGRVFAPALFKASHESEKTFKMFAGMMTRFLAIAGLTAGVAAFVMADELILLIFGEDYVASIPILRILGGVMAAKCMMVALQLLLSSIDMHFQRVASLGITIVVHICVNALLIPKFGALGAAGTSLFSGVLLLTLYVWSSSRRRHLQFLRWLVLPSCLAAMIAAIALLIDVNAIVATFVSILVFLIGLYATGFVRRDEFTFVMRSIFAKEGK